VSTYAVRSWRLRFGVVLVLGAFAASLLLWVGAQQAHASASQCGTGSDRTCAWADSPFSGNFFDPQGMGPGSPAQVQDFENRYDDGGCSGNPLDEDWNDCISSVKNGHTTCQTWWFVKADYQGNYFYNVPGGQSGILLSGNITVNTNCNGCDFNDQISSVQLRGC